MAKAREIEDIDCGEDVLEHAAKVLRVRFEEIFDLREKTLDQSDIEGVHAMRVATRRLRSAMRDFMPLMRKKPLKKAAGEIKKLADTLGAARDRDVAILALEKLHKKARVSAVKDGIENLLAEHRGLREKAQTILTAELDAPKLQDLHDRFNAAIDKAARRKNSDTAISFGEAGAQIVGKSLDDFCKLTVHIYEPFNQEPLHELRIRAKRLRYAVELYKTCRGDKISSFAEGVAEMQGFLGEVHDADVWIESLSKRMSDGDASEANIWLLSEYVAKRTENYRAALKLWSDWKKENFIEQLRNVISNAG